MKKSVSSIGALLAICWIFFFNNSSYADNTSANQGNAPNIVMILADDHGTDALGAYGNPVVQTPNLDALARSGTMFSNAYASSSSCSPSRTVLLTGMHNHANGMYGLMHRDHHFSAFSHLESLPTKLNALGYRTARVGKYHLAPDSVFKFDQVLSAGVANDMASVARSPAEMVNLSESFIKEGNGPFFLYFASDDPHRGFPFETAPEPNRFGNREQGYPGINKITYDPDDVLVPDFLPDTPEMRKELAEYYQSVSRLDQGVGKLIELLKRTNQYDNTLIIYLSDNGIAFAGAKTTVYDPGIRLPLIVRAPGRKQAGLTSDAMVSWVDIAPTILDFAGVDVAESESHGRSFKAILEGDINQPDWSEVYASHSLHEIQMYYPMRMVRTRNYKLIWNIAHPLEFPFARDLKYALSWLDFDEKPDKKYGQRAVGDFVQRPEFELYDVVSDPHEIHNLADDDKYAKICEELKGRLREFQEKTNDPWAQKWKFE